MCVCNIQCIRYYDTYIVYKLISNNHNNKIRNTINMHICIP